jgi:hypothetical protein
LKKRPAAKKKPSKEEKKEEDKVLVDGNKISISFQKPPQNSNEIDVRKRDIKD